MPEVKTEKQTGEDSYELWGYRLAAALDWRKKCWTGDESWKLGYRLYRGDHWQTSEDGKGNDFEIPDSENPRDRVTVNLTGSTVQDFLPFLIKHGTEFLASPKKKEAVQNAKLQTAALNYYWVEQRMTKQVKRASLDAVIIGHGVVKTGWFTELDESATPNKDGQLEYDDFVREDHPFVRRVNPFLFIYDPEAPGHDLETARWCAEIIFTPLQDVLANRRYSEKVRRQIRDGEVTPESVQSFLSHRDKDDAPEWMRQLDEVEQKGQQRIVKYEVWDKKFEKYYVFAAGVEEPLMEQPWPYNYLDGFPFEKVDFIEIPDEHYGMGLPFFVEDQQLELNRIRTAEFIHRRRFNRKYEVTDGMVDEAELSKLQSGEDGTIIKSKSGDGTPMVRPIQDAPISGDTYRLEAVIKEDFRELSGSDQLLRGGNLPSRTSATEIKARTSLLGLKLQERQEAFEDFQSRIARQVLQHIRANLTAPLAVKIRGEQGIVEWQEVSQKDIQAEFDIELASGPKENIDKIQDRQQRAQLMQMVMSAYPMLVQAGAPVDLKKLIGWVLEAFERKDIDEWFLPPGSVPALEAGAGLPTSTDTTNADQRINQEAVPPESAILGALMG